MSAPFSIDPETGRIRFPDLCLELGPLMSQQEFIAATAALNRDNLGANDGWQRYSIRQPISGDRKLGLFIVFLHERLNLLTFAYAEKDETWAIWSEAREREHEREYRLELSRQLGDRDTFPWGTARVQPDSKTGGIGILVRFSDSASPN